MIFSTSARCSQFLALGPAPIDHLLQKTCAHLQDAPGHDVVQRGHALEERDVLEGAGNAGGRRLVGAHLAAGDPLPGHLALLGMIEAIDHIEHRGLAGPVRSDDRPDLAFTDIEADIGKGGDAAEAQGHMVNRQQDRRLRGGPSGFIGHVEGCRHGFRYAAAVDKAVFAALDVADGHVGPDLAGAPVLEGHFGLHDHAILAAVEGVDQRRVTLVDDGAAHLSRAGQLAFVRIEFLVEQEKTPDRWASGKEALTFSTSSWIRA